MSQKSLKGTQTEKNIVNAFMEECQAYARYNYYASKADKESYFPVGEMLRETANNEFHHGKVYLKMLEDNEVECSSVVDAGFLATTDTEQNLAITLKEESVGGYEAYAAYAETARKEGFDDIANHFDAIGSIEKSHYDRFAKALKMITEGTLWKRDHDVVWKCLVCGYIHVGQEPPKTCPGCDHPYQHYVCLEDGFAPAPFQA